MRKGFKLAAILAGCIAIVLAAGYVGYLRHNLNNETRTYSHQRVFDSPASKPSPLGPMTVQFHSFTQIKDWTGDGEPDGIEAIVEFDDQFGDPTKATGNLTFELFEPKSGKPNQRGSRLRYWAASITTLEDQKLRWNPVSRTYRFQLSYPEIERTWGCILCVQFQTVDGRQLASQTLLGAPR